MTDDAGIITSDMLFKIAENEKKYKQTIHELELELDEAEQQNREQQIEYERLQTANNEKIQKFNEHNGQFIEDLKLAHQVVADRLRNDGERMSRDIQVLKEGLYEYMQQIQDLKNENEQLRQRMKVQFRIQFNIRNYMSAFLFILCFC
jgi:hypothetical protein